MKTASSKRYKFINSQTGYAIFYYTLKEELSPDQTKAELEKIRAQVAIQNGLFMNIIFWEEIKEE